MATLRKAYEIGTQYILLQTVVQIEGDITSYVTTKFLEMKGSEQEVIMKMHNTAMDTSIRLWQYLFQTIGSLLGGISGGMFGKKTAPAAASGGSGFFKRMFGK
jgi:phage-related minor tail protein